MRAREARARASHASPVPLSVFTLGPDLSIEDRAYSYDKPTQKTKKKKKKKKKKTTVLQSSVNGMSHMIHFPRIVLQR